MIGPSTDSINPPFPTPASGVTPETMTPEVESPAPEIVREFADIHTDGFVLDQETVQMNSPEPAAGPLPTPFPSSPPTQPAPVQHATTPEPAPDLNNVNNAVDELTDQLSKVLRGVAGPGRRRRPATPKALPKAQSAPPVPLANAVPFPNLSTVIHDPSASPAYQRSRTPDFGQRGNVVLPKARPDLNRLFRSEMSTQSDTSSDDHDKTNHRMQAVEDSMTDSPIARASSSTFPTVTFQSPCFVEEKFYEQNFQVCREKIVLPIFLPKS